MSERLRKIFAADVNSYPPFVLRKAVWLPIFFSWPTREACARAFAGLNATEKSYKQRFHLTIVLSEQDARGCDTGDDVTYVCDCQPWDYLQRLAQRLKPGMTIRVVRGPNPRSLYAPKEGFRYDGLYRVLSASPCKNANGFLVQQYRLQRVAGQPLIPRKARR